MLGKVTFSARLIMTLFICNISLIISRLVEIKMIIKKMKQAPLGMNTYSLFLGSGSRAKISHDCI
jgi:hypothetical protein